MSFSLTSHLDHGPNGLESDPLRNFKFLVKIEHRDVPGSPDIGFTLGFTSVSGLSVSTESIAYRQGGYNTTAQQIPGQSTFSPVTLQRGVLLGTQQNWNWMRQLFDVNVGNGTGRRGGGTASFRGDVFIYVLAHPITGDNVQNAPVRVHLHNAWPSSISYSDLNAGDNAFLVEQMTLVHEGFDLGWDTAVSRVNY